MSLKPMIDWMTEQAAADMVHCLKTACDECTRACAAREEEA